MSTPRVLARLLGGFILLAAGCTRAGPASMESPAIAPPVVIISMPSGRAHGRRGRSIARRVVVVVVESAGTAFVLLQTGRAESRLEGGASIVQQSASLMNSPFS